MTHIRADIHRDRAANKPVRNRAAEHPALIALDKFITQHRIIEEIGEVGSQAEFVMGRVGGEASIAYLAAKHSAKAGRLPAQIIVDIAKSVDQPAGNSGFWHLIGRGPPDIIGIELEREAVGLSAKGIPFVHINLSWTACYLPCH